MKKSKSIFILFWAVIFVMFTVTCSAQVTPLNVWQWGGNTINTATVSKLGTKNAQIFSIITNNTNAITISTTQAVTINKNVKANNYIARKTNVTSSNSVTVLTVNSQNTQQLTGTNTHTFNLPNATTLDTNHVFIFNNNSTGVLSIANTGSTVLFNVPGGGHVSVRCQNISTANGTWDMFVYGPSNASWGTSGLNLASGGYSVNGVAIGGGSGWSLTGNSSVSSSTNFIGTTDSNPIVFRTNNDTTFKANVDKSIVLYNTASENTSQSGAIWYSNEFANGTGFTFNSNTVSGGVVGHTTFKSAAVAVQLAMDNTSICQFGTGTITDFSLMSANNPLFTCTKDGYNTSIGKLYIGTASVTPTGYLTIKGPATNAAQINLESGIAPTGTNIIAGNIYRVSDDYFVTIQTNTAVQKLARCLTGSASLNFPSTGASAVSDLTVTVTGAAVNDQVSIGVPNGAVTATASFWGWVSATNVVTVRFSPKATEDPASGTFKISVFKN